MNVDTPVLRVRKLSFALLIVDIEARSSNDLAQGELSFRIKVNCKFGVDEWWSKKDQEPVKVNMNSSLNQRIRHLELPDRMSGLKVSDEGFPVPWFVPWIDGKPEFRGMDGEKFGIAVRHRRCWLCGQPLGKYLCFPIGPMCVVNRNISEPPSHLECSEYGVRACPFLSNPRMRRNEKDPIENGHIAGIGIRRNPGVTCLWTTLSFRLFRAPNGGHLFAIGDPEHFEFYAEGRKATREEILASMESGLPNLMREAVKEGSEAVAALNKQYAKALELV